MPWYKRLNKKWYFYYLLSYTFIFGALLGTGDGETTFVELFVAIVASMLIADNAGPSVHPKPKERAVSPEPQYDPYDKRVW